MDATKTPKIYVTQEVAAGRINYSPARAFGTIKFLTVMDVSSEDDSIHNKMLVDEVRSKLSDFNCDTDHIVITGSPLVAAIVFMVIREKSHKVNILRWSNISHNYTAVTINLL